MPYAEKNNGLGSPPRMRGKESTEMREMQAGKDHPRVCGEKGHTAFSFVQLVGSPPRMRGKARQNISILSVFQITPAYAGKS